MGHDLRLILISIITLSAIGGLSGLLLAYSSEKFKVVVDPRVEEVLGLLPRVNCGACGYPSCIELAEKIVAGEADPLKCKVGGKSTAEKIVHALNLNK